MSNEKDQILNYFKANLDVLAKVKNGDKLYINNQNILEIDEPYMFQGLWRYCRNISRRDAINVINKLLNDIEIYFNSIILKNTNSRTGINHRFNDEDTRDCSDIANKLFNIWEGINNMKITYSTDKNIIDELDIILNKMNNLYNNLKNMI